MKQLVIIGNGMASARLVEYLLQSAPQHYQITVFGAEPCASYNRIMLSPVLGGEKTFTDIVLPQAAAEHNVCYRLGEAVTHIDRARRCIVTSRGEMEYDHLVIATGARRCCHRGLAFTLRALWGFVPKRMSKPCWQQCTTRLQWWSSAEGC